MNATEKLIVRVWQVLNECEMIYSLLLSLRNISQSFCMLILKHFNITVEKQKCIHCSILISNRSWNETVGMASICVIAKFAKQYSGAFTQWYKLKTILLNISADTRNRQISDKGRFIFKTACHTFAFIMRDSGQEPEFCPESKYFEATRL